MPTSNALLSGVLSHVDRTDFIEVTVLLVVVGLFWLFPLLLDRWFSALERAAARLARRKRAAALSIALGVVLVRLAALPVLPIPIPRIHDEFSNLLAGDTFAHARLANPPHPMWVFFDTIHVNQNPMYMSKYPPGQGTVLALGQILGNPWIGVLLSCAAMCAAVLWALGGWLPDSWALVGAALFTFHIGIFSYWMNSYWGGAVAATGGALVIGAYPRVLQTWKVRDAALLGIGTAILALSRPLEGLIFCIPVALGLLTGMWKKRRVIRPGVFLKAAACLCAIGILLGAFECYYNFRGTGNALLSPYTLNDRQYLTTPVFGWGTPGPPFRHTSPQLDGFYNGWARNSWYEGRSNSLGAFFRVTAFNIAKLTHFFLWPELSLVVPSTLLLFRSNPFRFLLIQLAVCVAGFALVPWFNIHYAAPLACTLYIVLTQGLRELRQFTVRGRPLGTGLARAVVLLVVAFAPGHRQPVPDTSPAFAYRAEFARNLSAAPGKQLVIVRYGDSHDPSAEWVYNAADIDHAKIVWAREIPDVDLKPLLTYFRDRQMWLAEPDADPPRLIPYTAVSPGQATLN